MPWHPSLFRPISVLLALTIALPLFAASTTPIDGERTIYKRVGELALPLYVVRPTQWLAGDRRPAVVFFHGGGWVGGTPAQFNDQGRRFAALGLVCIHVRYRFVPPKTTEPPRVCIADARSAFRWVRAHAAELGIDPHRIAAAGGSAGGHLAAHLGLVSGGDDPVDDLRVSVRPDALILFNPVLDNSPGNYGAERVGDNLAELSPAQNVSATAPPAIVFLGARDQLIPVATLERFRDRMQAAGVRCELHLYEGQAHGFFNAKNAEGKYFELTQRAAEEFLASLGWIKPGASAPAPASSR